MKKLFSLLLIISNLTSFGNNYSPLSLAMPCDSFIYSTTFVIKAHDSKIYIGTDHGLNIYDHGNWQHVSDTALGQSYVVDIAFEDSNKIWLTTDGAVLILDTNINVTTLTNLNSSLPFYISRNIVIDDSSVKWISGFNIGPVYQYGIVKYDDVNWTLYDSTNSPLSNEYHIMKTDKSGNLWFIGQASGELLRFDGNAWTTFTDIDFQIPGGIVSAMDCDNSGIMWFSIYDIEDNLVQYDGNNFITMATTQFFPPDPAAQLTIDEYGNKWLLSSGIWISKFDGTQLIRYVDTVNLPLIRTISAIGKNLWIGQDVANDCNVYVLNENGYNEIKGEVYFDSNNDGIKQANEIKLPNVLLHLMPQNQYVFSDTSGYTISMFDTAGTYSLEMIAPAHWHSFNPIQSAMQTYEGEVTDSVNFDLYIDATTKDVSVEITTSTMRPGFNAPVWINIRNKSALTISDTVTLILDPHLSFNSSIPSPVYQSNDTVKWYYSNLLPLETRTILVNSLVSSSTVLGNQIYLNANIQPIVGDTFPSDNYDTLSRVVTGSFDPNSKEVHPEGIGSSGSILPGQQLEYVVNFQNTGTDTAFTVEIRDTLSGELDLATLEITGFSHPVTYQIYGRALIFTFSNILLPDSNTDEPHSHGFVKYRILPNANILHGAVIDNIAAIFFDFNLPVITNPVSNSIDYFLSSENHLNTTQLLIYPNPARNEIFIQAKTDIQTVEIYSMEGKLIKCQKNYDRKLSVGLENISPGVYLIKAKGEKAVYFSKFVKQ